MHARLNATVYVFKLFFVWLTWVFSYLLDANLQGFPIL